MRLSRDTPRTFTSLLLLSAAVLAVGNIDCSRIVVDKTTFDLSKLGGPHTVMHSIEQPPSWRNTTYTIDICNKLERPRSVHDTDSFCPGGTRVCAVEHIIHGDADVVSEVIPIAGDLQEHKGGSLDAKLERLRTSASNADSEKEGVRITLNGGIYNSRNQKAVVEFVCTRNRTGDEGSLPKKESEKESRSMAQLARAANYSSTETEDGEFCMPSLSFKSYGPDPGDDKTDLLRMEWLTKYACEEQAEEDKPQSNSWGFFTWFIIIGFMGTAAYLVFGSWLNYNRYGARGWDLLPHGDTIRDVPYLLKDWTRKVLNTVQGGGVRGGYSAV